MDTRDSDPLMLWGCRWDLYSLEPSEAPGTWQQGSSSAPSVLHPTGSCGKHGIFRIWGSLEQGRGGPRPEAAVAAARIPGRKRGRMSLCPGLYWAAEQGAQGHFSSLMGMATGTGSPQLHPCSSLPQEVASAIGWVSEARAVLASILPSHQGQPCRDQNLKLAVPTYT